MRYDWDILLDDVSIADKVESFSIVKTKDSFCKQCSITIHDYSLYSSLYEMASEISSEPRIEIRTRVGGTWATEGTFFIEQISLSQDADTLTPITIWGRDAAAVLTQPYTLRKSKQWNENTTLFGIIQEVLELCGLEYSESRVEINDYVIYAYSYSVEKVYPIDILRELVGKTDGYLNTDADDKVWVKRDLYDLDSPTDTIDEDDIARIEERIEYPEFFNRVRVSSFSKTEEAELRLSLETDEIFVACGESIGAKAIVTDNDGAPVADGAPVDWTTDNDDYAYWFENRTHVYTHQIENEGQIASSLYSISVDYPIRQVHSVTEVRAIGNRTREVAKFSGRTISLSEDEPLTYTDSAVLITYETAYAENTLIGGSTGEVEVDVHAIVDDFIRDTVTMRIDTAAGDEAGSTAKYVTMEYIDFHTEEPIEEVAFSLDGVAKGLTDENGQLDIGLVSGGLHSIVATKTGYTPSNDENEGLDNDQIYVGTASVGTSETGDGDGDTEVTEHNELSGLQGGTTSQYYHLTAAQLAGLHTRKHSLDSSGDHNPLSGNENEIVTLTAEGMLKSSGKEFISTSTGAPDAGKPIVLDAGGKVDATMINDGDIDHGSIAGLGDDDHSQYALLAGRAGGQTLKGGTLASQTLTLQSTAHATKGKILFGTSAYDEVNNRLGLGTQAPNQQLELTGNMRLAVTTSSSVGVIYKNGSYFMHDFKPAGADGWNQFMGVGAGNFTMAIGAHSYEASVNLGVGPFSCLSLTTGYNNVGIGANALQATTTGYDNMALGRQAMILNTTGYCNVAVGYNSLSSAQTIPHNVAIGFQALKALTGTGYSTAVGSSALMSATTGHSNTALGFSSLLLVTQGIGNIGIGFATGDNITTGSYNIVIGYNLDAPSATVNYQLNIGGTIYGKLDRNLVGIGGSTFDGTAQKVLQITGSTEPGGSVADTVQFYEKDSSQGGGHGTLGLYLEEAVEAIASDDVVSHKIRVWINGVEYWIHLDAV